MSRTWAPSHQRDVSDLFAVLFLLLTLLAVSAAYVLGQAAQDRRCERGGCERVEGLGRSWT